MVFLKFRKNYSKTSVLGYFLNKDLDWGPATLLQRGSGIGISFSMNSAKFLKTLILEMSVNGKIF